MVFSDLRSLRKNSVIAILSLKKKVVIGCNGTNGNFTNDKNRSKRHAVQAH